MTTKLLDRDREYILDLIRLDIEREDRDPSLEKYAYRAARAIATQKVINKLIEDYRPCRGSTPIIDIFKRMLEKEEDE